MIWVIANSKDEDGSFPTYKYYKKAFADGCIDIYCANQNDDFSFLRKEDTAFIRTRDENINNCVREAQKAIGFKSTLESRLTCLLTYDKVCVKSALAVHGIPFPSSICEVDNEIGRKYFVKPRYGGDSIGIDAGSICSTKSQVEEKCTLLKDMEIIPMVERYIEGRDVTTAVIYSSKDDSLKIYSAFTDADNPYGIQMDSTKSGYSFVASSFKDERVERMSRRVFDAVGARHYLRIDFRISDDIPYVIDINMIPGLAPNGYMAKCMEVNDMGYYDMVRMVVGSAF